MKNSEKKLIINHCLTYAKSLMKKEHNSHGWDHVERVITLADKLAQKEGADRFTVKVAAILHDIARETENRSKGKFCHAKLGSAMAEKFLKKIQMDPKIIKLVSNCIKEHRFRNNHNPSSLESKVLFDADKLDSLGAIGIGRAFVFSGEIGARVHVLKKSVEKTRAYSEDDTAFREYQVKLKHIKDRMQTKYGKKMAKDRSNFMKNFFHRLDKESNGLA